MSFYFHPPRSSALDTFAGGEADLGDIWRAARDAAIYVDNSLARGQAMEEAYDRRIEAIRAATGTTLDNPQRAAVSGMPSREELASMLPGESRYDAAKRRFRDELSALAERFPDKADLIGAGRTIEEDARAITSEASESVSRLAGSRPGLAKWGALLGGGLSGSLRDPLQVAAIVASGGPGAARTIGGRILTVAAKEALINGAVEASLQPMVQAWRAEAGLDHGVEQAMLNIVFAAGAGALLGGGVQGAGELIGRALRGADLDRAAGALAADTRIREPVRRALAGDAAAAATELPTIREALPAEARGALDAIETARHFDAEKPRAIEPDTHDQAMTRASRALEAGPDEPLRFDIDEAQLTRIVERVMPESARPAISRQTGLTEFLAKAGGIDIADPDVGGSDLARVTVPFRGKLAKKGGMPLDRARELAAQNGYLWEFGNVDAATASTRPDDLLQLLFRESRGERVVPFDDATDAASRAADDFDAGRAQAEDYASAILSREGPGLDDETVIRAMEAMRDEGIDASAAVARVAPNARAGQPAAGFDDASLLEASDGRQLEPFAGTLEETFDHPEKFTVAARDVEAFGDETIPWDDGPVTFREAIEAIDRGDHYATILEACRL
ncbi:hypothetical protein [Oricola sp.]|uniref:hypothetical protein n=1 Tax=Oricola sp. TaxID=1979950 RepID=UPI0025DD63C1|nr:hypothetical protein [Oricola sp.]MCI5075642.1 hypothetical protein [Oricola sp.]